MRRAALLAMLAAGALLRIWMLHAWRPAFIGYYDTAAYVTAARGDVFADQFRPAGYPLALRLLHHVDDRVVAVTVVQHLLGLATAVLLYLIVRAHARHPWWALLAPAVVLFDGFAILIEHALLSDTLFVFLVVAALYCALRPRLALAAGALIAAAAVTRTVGLFVVPLMLIVPRNRIAVFAGCVLVFGAYLHAGGRLSMSSGWGLYARVGQFADCSRFTAPDGTRQLCETSDPASRQSTDFYYWSPHSPAQRAFGSPPAGDRYVGAFAHAALRAQPLDYLATVATDFGRYVAPGHHKRPRAGETQDQYLSQAQRPNELAFIRGELVTYYRAVPAAERAHTRLTLAYTGATLVRGPLMLVLLVLAALAPLLARTRAAILLAGTAFVLLLVPVATQVYDARYALDALGPLSAAAALALDALSPRAPRRLRPRAAR